MHVAGLMPTFSHLMNIMTDSYTYKRLNPDTEHSCIYNSNRARLKMPAYGRVVQDMVEYALTLEDPNERQRYAEAIADVMIELKPELKDEQDYRQKIWNHLAYIADYKLDIQYPCEIMKEDAEHQHPCHLTYPKKSIFFRHYGRLVEQAVDILKDMPEGEERDALVKLVGNRMKRNLADWKGDGVDDRKVAHDIAFYTEGKVNPDFSQPGQQLMPIGENRFRTRKNKQR